MEEKYSKAQKVAQQIADVMQSECIKDDERLREWMETNPSSEDVVELFVDEKRFADAVGAFDKEEMCRCSEERLRFKIKQSQQKKRRHLSLLYGSVAAALIAVSMLVWNDEKEKVEHLLTTSFQSEIATMNVATPTLILTDGEEITLSDSLSSRIIAQDYLSKIDSTVVPSECCNTLIIPSRYTFSTVLPDGTKVILNANSKLIYPIQFDKTKREVTLEGEAFFEVSKSDVPFIVKSKGVSVRVYGTKFNINNYYENQIETVLFSGSVGISMEEREDLPEQMLKPNQLSKVNVTKGTAELREVDADGYISWIGGRIKSYDSTLGDLICKLSCWYGVEFEFVDSEKCQIPITASFNREQSIVNVIRAIEYAAKVKIEMKEGGYMIH